MPADLDPNVSPNRQEPAAQSLNPNKFETALKSPFFTIISVFVLGFGVSTGVWKFLYDAPRYASDKAKNSNSKSDSVEVPNADVPVYFLDTGVNNIKFPITIGVFGPLTGKDSSFGISQLRGVYGGALHLLSKMYHKDKEVLSDYIKIIKYDDGIKGEHETTDSVTFDGIFALAEKQCKIIFGPYTSETTNDMILKRNTHLSVPWVLTEACTSAARNHQQYGSMIGQLSNNITSYATQFMDFFLEYRNKPKKIFCFYRRDEFGTSSTDAFYNTLTTSVKGLDNSYYNDFPIDPLQAKNDYQDIINFLHEKNAINDPSNLIFVIEWGKNLSKVISCIRKKYPLCQIATLTSLQDDEIKSGNFDSIYTIYSYLPQLTSIQTMEFTKFCSIGNRFLERVLGSPTKSMESEKPGTIEAEVHDATIYALYRILRKTDLGPGIVNERALYTTSFIISGKGKNFGNEGSLYIAQVKDSVLKPVDLEFK
jgi:hypothetical protein